MNPTQPDPNNLSDAVPLRIEGYTRASGTSRGERWFRSLVQNSSDVVMILEAEGTVRYVSPAVERVLGYRPEEMVGSLALDYVHPEDVEYMSKSFAQTLQKPGVHPPVEYRVRTADGSWRHMEAIRSNWLDDPNVAGVVANIRDITERKKAEEALKESEERYRTLMEQSVEAIYLYDAETKRILESNAAFRRMMGYAEEELLGMRIYDFIAHDKEDIDQHVQRSLKEKRRHIGERRYRRKDGSVIVVDTSASVISYGGRTALCAVSRDVTERKRAQEALKGSEKRFRSLLQNASDVITILEADGTIQYDSPAIKRVLGYRPEERIGKSGFDYVHPEDLGWAKRSFTEAVDCPGVQSSVEFRLRHKDGSWRHLEVTRTNLLDNPAVRGVVVNFHDITERKEAEEALRQSEERYRAVVEQTIEGIYLGAADTKLVLESNAAFQKMLGYTAEELRGMHIYDFIAHDRENIDSVFQSILDRGHCFIGERRYRRKDGSKVDVETSATVISYDEREVVCTVVRDVTERKKAEERLREAEARYRTVVEEQTELVCRFLPDLTLTFANEAYCRYFELEPGEVIGKSFIERVAVEDRVYYEQQLAWLNKENPTRMVEHRVLTPGGGERWQQWTDTAIFDAEGRIIEYQSVGRDVTERRALEERLEHRALHDPLTDLPNRQLLVDRLGHALARSGRRRDSGVAVLFMDLDGFKVVNDSLGHEIGDRLLVAVAERLKGCLRPEDTLARFAGDEFIVLLEEVEGADDVLRITQRITEEFLGPFVLDGRELVVRLSIGVALGDAHTESPEELLRDADAAMYRAKADAVDYRVFDPGMYEQALSRMELENDLRRALEKEEFRVYYQPKFRLGQKDRVEGIEALLRWEHPQRGLMLPEDFIPIAEETGLIISIGGWVMREACLQAKVWQERYPSEPPLSVCVNLSAGQVRHPGLLQDVRSTLRESGLEVGYLILEITEGTLLKDTEMIETVFRELKALGVRLAIDDFGKEYSSLSYLKRLPVDSLKIDGSFIGSLGEDPSSTTIVEAVISLAHSLGLEVTGEGVESAEQLEHLRSMRCDLVQGYHLARPLPSEEVEQLLADHFTEPQQDRRNSGE